MLRMNGAGATSAAADPVASTNGTNSSNGILAASSAKNSQTLTGSITVDPLERARSASRPAASPALSNSALVKNEDSAKPSPSFMPATAALPQNGLSGLSGAPASSTVNGSPMLPPVQGSNLANGNGYTTTSFERPSLPNPASETKWRQAGKSKTHDAEMACGNR